MSDADGMELDEDTVSRAPVTRTTKRNGRGKKVVTTRQEFVEPEEDDRVQLPGLFALSDIEEQSIVRVRVYRKDPDEGMVGYMEDPNSTEDEIKERWGGSQYRLEGLNNIGKIVAVRTVRIAGDPVFVSNSFRLEWEKRRGIQPQVAPGQQGMSVQEMMAFMREQDNERRRAEDERRSREAEERRQHEEKMRRLELEAEERRRRDERDREERKAKEDREREERRLKDEAEREDRRRKDMADAEARQRAHTDQMLAMVRASSEQALQLVKTQVTQAPQNNLMDAVKVIATIKEAFGGEAPNPENDDPLTLLMKHGHEWLTGIGSATQAVIREVKGGGSAPQVSGQPASPQLPATTPDGIVIPASSPLAGKLQGLVGSIAARGRNPEEVLSHVLDNLQATLDGKASPQTPPPASNAGISTQPATAATSPQPEPVAPAAPTVAPPATSPQTGPRIVKSEKTTRGSTRISFN